MPELEQQLPKIQPALTDMERPSARPEFAPRFAGSHGPLLLILVAGAVVRLALWMWFQDRPIEIFDERDYNQLAVNLAVHGEFAFSPGHPTSLRPPLYPALVAGMYRIFGLESFQAVRLFQAALSLVNVLLLYRLGLDLFSRKVGLWLAALYCFYPSLLGYNNLLLTEVLFTFLVCATCFLVIRSLQRDSLVPLALAGLSLGLAALTRSVMWLFPPVMCVFLLLVWKGGLARRLGATVILLTAFVAVVAPWAIRNSRLQRTFIAIDTMGGRNFMMGNYRYTPLYRSWNAIALDGEESWYYEVSMTYPPSERETQGHVDKLALRQGLTFVKANPGLTLQRDIIKFWDFWGLERELVAGAARGYFGPVSRPTIVVLTVLIFGSYAFALLFGVFGVMLAPPSDRRAHWFLLLVMAFICGMHTLVFAHSRYHLPLMPLILVYTASALVHARTLWQQRSGWRFRLACGVSGVFVCGWVWLIINVDLERYLSALRSIV
jgi:4-amino-4-deoxy-L-arabinose transferase-like glycosyltransferase